MTFADVIRRLMTHQDPDKLHADYRAWQRRVLQNMCRSEEFESL